MECEEELITAVYPQVTKNYTNIDWLTERAILAQKNDIVTGINKKILNQLPTQARNYTSVDSVVDEGMEAARDMALQMQADGKGIVLDQFNNPDNSQAHYLTTGPELWQQTGGKITHFISSMGTTGTITGVSQYLKEQNPDIQIIGLQPDEEASIAGIRRWPAAYMPGIYNADLVDEVMDVDQKIAEVYMRKLAKLEGIFAGVSSGAAAWAAVQVAKANPDAVIAFIVCDRGDRYLSTGLYNVNDADDSASA